MAKNIIDSFGLNGKVAVVTGAGQGIGKGIALRLAQEGAGVVIAEYNRETASSAAREIEESTGQRALAYPIDISDVVAVRQMVDDIVAELGHIDILVNNAGVLQTKPMMELTEKDWDYVIDVNQRGLFFCLQAVADQMIRQFPEEFKASQAPADVFSIKEEQSGRGAQVAGDVGSFGKIVNLSSIAGRRGRPLSTHYAASKAAIINITQSAALALAPYRINVNAICPGIVPTPLWEKIDRDRGDLFGAEPGEAMAAFMERRPPTFKDA